ncbi:MAG TPA: hypothetical protein VGP72_10475 [Planctomycetota bacterium]|jgi:hypothetical protein
MAEQNASLILTIGTFNGTAFGVVQNFNETQIVGTAPISGQGKLGVSALGITQVTGHCVVTWVGGAGARPFKYGTKGPLAFTVKDCEGGATQDYPASNMVALGSSTVHSDRTFVVISQEFANVSDTGEFITTQG